LPLELLEKESKIEFNQNKLDPKVREYYNQFVAKKVDTKVGNAIDVANRVLEPLEKNHFKYDHISGDLIHKNILFHKKLEIINLEFDDKIAALVAQLLFKQYVIEG
jgi:hypothetical protein